MHPQLYRIPALAVAVGALLALCACGGSSDSAVEPPQSVSTEVGNGGGQLSLGGLALTLPTGALSTPLALSMSSLEPRAGEIARFRLAPAGQRLGAPSELRFAAPSLPGKTSFFFEAGGELRLIPGTLQGDVLTARISSLGLTDAGNLASAAASALPGQRAKTLAARALADAADGGVVVVMPVDCQAQIADLSRRLQRGAAAGDQALAVSLFNELQETQRLCAEAEVIELERKSCDALGTAIFNAQVLLANDFVAFQQLSVALFSGQAFVQLTGATCTAAAPALVAPLIAAKFEQFLQVLQGQQLRDGFAAEATVRDLRELFRFKATCDLLGLDSICDRLGDEIFPNLLDGMRRAAFDECRRTGAALVVSQFHFLGTEIRDDSKFLGFGRFRLADVEADIHYCTNPALDLSVFADALGVPEEIADRASTLRPLVSLGNYRRSIDIAVPRNGSLSVAGQVQALRCADGSASTADLVARVGSREVARRGVSGNAYPLSTNPLDLVVSRVLASAGLDPERTDGFTVVINREGGLCLGGGGPTLDQDLTLFEIRVNLGATGGPVVLRGSVALNSTLTTKTSRNGSTTEKVERLDIAASVQLDPARGVLVLRSSGYSGSVVETFRSVTPIDRAPCFFDAVTDSVDRTTITPRGQEPGTVGFSLNGDAWVLGGPELPVTTQRTRTTVSSTTNVRGDCTGFELGTTTRTDVSPSRSSSLDPSLSLVRRPAFQGTLLRSPQGLRSLNFFDTLRESVPGVEPGNSQSVTTTVQLDLADQPAP